MIYGTSKILTNNPLKLSYVQTELPTFIGYFIIYVLSIRRACESRLRKSKGKQIQISSHQFRLRIFRFLYFSEQ